jgi:hypothetical protein
MPSSATFDVNISTNCKCNMCSSSCCHEACLSVTLPQSLPFGSEYFFTCTHMHGTNVWFCCYLSVAPIILPLAFITISVDVRVLPKNKQTNHEHYQELRRTTMSYVKQKRKCGSWGSADGMFMVTDTPFIHIQHACASSFAGIS